MTTADPTPTTESTLTKLAQAGGVEIEDDIEDKAQPVTLSTPDDIIAAVTAAVTAQLQQADILPAPVTKVKKAKKKAKKTKKVARAQAKTAKAKKSAKKAAPSSGQSGPEIVGLDVEDLNDKELKLMNVFPVKGAREPFTITQLAKSAWPTLAKAKSNSWTRNCLRRLVRGGFLDKLKRGSYRLTVKGRNRMEKAAA